MHIYIHIYRYIYIYICIYICMYLYTAHTLGPTTCHHTILPSVSFAPTSLPFISGFWVSGRPARLPPAGGRHGSAGLSRRLPLRLCGSAEADRWRRALGPGDSWRHVRGGDDAVDNKYIYTHLVRHAYTRVLRTHTFITCTHLYNCISIYVQNMCTHDHTRMITHTYIYTSIYTCVYFIYINIHIYVIHTHLRRHALSMPHPTPPPPVSVVVSGALLGEPGSGVLDLHSNENGE